MATPLPPPLSLLHLATDDEWAAAQRTGVVAPPSLAMEGFVHCSTAVQIAGVVERYYASRADLILLRIDADQLGPGVEVRWEDGFPHVYGAIPMAAVVSAERWPPAPADSGKR